MKKIGAFCLLVALATQTAFAADYKSQLTGKRLVMSGAQCAGISFSKNAGLISEMGNAPPCDVDLPTRIRWVGDDSFLMIEKNQTSKDKPPRVYFYKVKSIVGKKVVLTNVWTGWNSFPDEDTTYFIK